MEYEVIKQHIKDIIIQKVVHEKVCSQVELAELVGVSKQSVSAWINQNSSPDAARIPAICKALNVTIFELLGIEDITSIEPFAKELFEAYNAHPEHQASIKALLGLK